MLAAERILERARSLGADLAGLCDVAPLRGDHSARVAEAPDLPAEARSALVLGLAHPEEEPSLDWWGGKGGTDGNRRLIRVARELRPWLEGELGLTVWILPYHVERGGLYLKDAAVLAGLGVLGANNLVVTPERGPRVRWKALLLDGELAGAPVPEEGRRAAGFDPCGDCPRPCLTACPRGALDGGRYQRSRCAAQMQADEAAAARGVGEGDGASPVRYCRACELACPVGRSADIT